MKEEFNEYEEWLGEIKKRLRKEKYPITSSRTDFLLFCILKELKKK